MYIQCVRRGPDQSTMLPEDNFDVQQFSPPHSVGRAHSDGFLINERRLVLVMPADFVAKNAKTIGTWSQIVLSEGRHGDAGAALVR